MAAIPAVGGGMEGGSPNNSANGGGGGKDSYWARDSQGGDIVYTTDTLLRCVRWVGGGSIRDGDGDEMEWFRTRAGASKSVCLYLYMTPDP